MRTMEGENIAEKICGLCWEITLYDQKLYSNKKYFFISRNISRYLCSCKYFYYLFLLIQVSLPRLLLNNVTL
uniref:Ovule protein n=1 Tax=Meloidogyne incognita TaxID=6306 RepID=A0A914L7J7_MELIC